MKAIVVRNTAGKIVCMGPDNGMYDVETPTACTKALEDNYELLIQDHMAYLESLPKVRSIEERVSQIEAQLAQR